MPASDRISMPEIRASNIVDSLRARWERARNSAKSTPQCANARTSDPVVRSIPIACTNWKTMLKTSEVNCSPRFWASRCRRANSADNPQSTTKHPTATHAAHGA